jgi:hypothetical protein
MKVLNISVFAVPLLLALMPAVAAGDNEQRSPLEKVKYYVNFQAQPSNKHDAFSDIRSTVPTEATKTYLKKIGATQNSLAVFLTTAGVKSSSALPAQPRASAPESSAAVFGMSSTPPRIETGEGTAIPQSGGAASTSNVNSAADSGQ